MKGALADCFDSLEAVPRVKGDRLRFGIGDDADATQRVTLIQRERQDMAEQRAPHTEALGPLIYAEPREPKDRERVGRQSSSHPCGGEVSPLQTSDRDGRESEQPTFYCGYVSYREVKLELVLTGVVVEEAIEIRLTARKRSPVVVGSEQPDLNVFCHASVPGAP